MSNRTIIEMNHDYASRIANDPSGFAATILELLRAGYSGADGDIRGATLRRVLRRYGATVTPTHHHSGDARLTLSSNGREYFATKF